MPFCNFDEDNELKSNWLTLTITTVFHDRTRPLSESVLHESSAKPSLGYLTRLGLSEDSRTTDLWLGLLVLILTWVASCRKLWQYLNKLDVLYLFPIDSGTVEYDQICFGLTEPLTFALGSCTDFDEDNELKSNLLTLTIITVFHERTRVLSNHDLAARPATKAWCEAYSRTRLLTVDWGCGNHFHKDLNSQFLLW